MHLPIPPNVIYAGLAGCVLALIVATATNGWRPRVFFLLALRLAIGWHFLFEGLHKIHSVYVGPSETNRVFTSEPYFAAAEGPLGEVMRKNVLGDPVASYTPKLTKKKEISAADFAKLSEKEQAELCPDAAAAVIGEATTDADATQAGKAAFARWVYGVDGRDTKVKFVSNADVPLTAPQRLAHIEWLRKEVAESKSREAADLGNGYGIEQKRAAGVRTDLNTAEKDLAKDTEDFISTLHTAAGGKDPEPQPKKIAQLDLVTRWTITAVGIGLLAGLFTRVWCLVGAGFLVMTYLSHPTVPWLPLPPMTEGNPLFINKNLIEALALLALMTLPTGQWLGLDALLFRKKRKTKT